MGHGTSAGGGGKKSGPRVSSRHANVTCSLNLISELLSLGQR